MQPYNSLTKQGKVRRLRNLALNALGQYDLDITNLCLVGAFTNTVFRVWGQLKNAPDHSSGRDGAKDGSGSYILRVCLPGWRTETDLRSEAIWLQALSHDTDIGAPQPYAARNGEFIVTAGAPGVPEERRCILMGRLPGTLLGKQLTEANLYKMGVLFARLHAHAVQFNSPPGFTQRKMDSLYARGEEDLLFSEACVDAFTPYSRQIFELTAERVNQTFASLYARPEGLRVIHNDLWHDNIKVDHGRLRPFDFEDTLWGYPVQDIAMALQDLMKDVPAETFEPLQCAFRCGYESLSSWPERWTSEIDTLRAGRMLWVCNYVARFERQYLPGHIEWVSPMFERFLETGLVRL